MARPRSETTASVKEKLIARLSGGFHRPGERFFSNRSLATRFGISYQTADRLVRELVDEGWLERRPSSGTYISGKPVAWQGAVLVFHERAKRAGSFGARLLDDLGAAFEQAGLRSRVLWTMDQAPVTIGDGWLPVLWECPRTMAQLAGDRRFLLVMNDTPPPGLASSYVDAVACDDVSGGAAAAELLRDAVGGGSLAVLAGPSADRRSQLRVEGFRSMDSKAQVFWGKSWDADSATEIAGKLVRRKFAGVFCCSDRLAQGLLALGTSAAVVGFDDAPVAETLDLTTIAVPWEEMVAGAVEIVRRRMTGDTGAAARRIFSPRPVVRRFFHMSQGGITLEKFRP